MGLLLDIRDTPELKRTAAVADSNFFWYSATFSNDGKMVLFPDEWGGWAARLTAARTTRRTGVPTRSSRSRTAKRFSRITVPRRRRPWRTGAAHNGSLIPIPGRTIMVQAWYQGDSRSRVDRSEAPHTKSSTAAERRAWSAAATGRRTGANGHIIGSADAARARDV